MSSASTPVPNSYGTPPQGYAGSPSPAPSGSSSGAPPSSKPGSSSKPKPTNVFSNDGSFLERFQRLKREEEEKKKQEDAVAKKRNFDQRFKNRGKRPSPDSTVSTSTTDEPAAKKAKGEEPKTQYEREVKSYTSSLKDNGIGVRPLVK
ncbi:hypothetical protein JAAARDRAFT_203863 [Jaapia argillacea MUCL 33604]|uniref:Uncharacterized protein n=1 Tax=Jaapia argillacea MUCL 33604 TaxID=933084 RepID=A0A067QH33_9AGAM|nr:hypothetical protein JAAARDRAFT_203863 [Jaapia argillacea MUCL 33604]